MAQTRQARRSRRGRYEDELAALLVNPAWTVIQQRAIGQYNVDIALEEPRVAVEVYASKPSHGNPGRTPLTKRLEYLLDDGWLLLVLGIGDRNPYRPGVRSQPNLDAITKHVIALAQRASADESMRGCYGVIGRQGQPMTTPRFQLDHRPRIANP
jgi:hypothetical protein